MLTVRDTGSGMDAETKAKILARFLRRRAAAKAPDSACRWCMGSCSKAAGFWPSKASLGWDQASKFISLVFRRQVRRPRSKPASGDVTGSEKFSSSRMKAPFGN